MFSLCHHDIYNRHVSTSPVILVMLTNSSPSSCLQIWTAPYLDSIQQHNNPASSHLSVITPFNCAWLNSINTKLILRSNQMRTIYIYIHYKQYYQQYCTTALLNAWHCTNLSNGANCCTRLRTKYMQLIIIYIYT